MRLILQLGLMVLLLLGAGNRVWGKVAVGETIAVRDFAESGVFVSVRDAPPGLMSSGEAAVWGHDLGMQDGPNLYAYVKENPWTAWDPHGLRAQTKDESQIIQKLHKTASDIRRGSAKAFENIKRGSKVQRIADQK